METLFFATCSAAGIERSDLYLAWDFTVASERQPDRADAAHPRRRLRALGDTDLADGVVQGQLAGADQIDHGHRDRRGEDPRIARKVKGNVTVPCYLTRRLRARGSTFNYATGPVPTLDRAAAAAAGTTPRPSPSMHPAPTVDRDPATDRARPRSTATACSAPRARSTRQRPARWPTSTGSMFLRDRLVRVRDRRTSRTSLAILQDVSHFPLLGRRHPAGLPQLPLPRPGDDPPGRLRRQTRLPGRGRRPAGHRHRASSSTTATARAASSAAASPRSRPT